MWKQIPKSKSKSSKWEIKFPSGEKNSESET